jgi:replicative DNA helicase
MNQNLISKLENIIGNRYADEKEVLFRLKQLLIEYEILHRVTKASKSIAELVSENVQQLQQEAHGGNIIKTGFIDFDQLFGGFGLGEFVVIGARPSMGKTQLLVNLALHFSQSMPVLYFTFDLSDFLLTNRCISSLSGIPVDRMLHHDLSLEEKERLPSFETAFRKHNLFVNDSCNASITAFKVECTKLIQEQGVKVIIVDYLQMMSSTKYRNNRDLEIGLISRELKNIAKDFNVCVIASSQLNRSVESRGGSKHPQLADLRESGAIEQDADKVIFVYRAEYYGFLCDEDGNNTVGVTDLILAKNRNGKLGSVKLMRDSNFTNFRDFAGYKNTFSFSQNRLDELVDPSDAEDTPF